MKYKYLLTLSVLFISACSASKTGQEDLAIQDSYKYQSKIVMQRVQDTKPLAKQDLVSREAMQYAMIDKMNAREQRMQREFNRARDQQNKDFLSAQKQQRDDFLAIEKRNNETMQTLATTLTEQANEIKERSDVFIMAATRMDQNSTDQINAFESMKASYDKQMAVEKAKLDREKDRENSIRGVVENMYEEKERAMEQFYQTVQEGMLPPSEWVDLEDARVVIHVEDEQFDDLVLRALNNAAVEAGPWNLKWKLKRENEELLYTKFSLDAETTFGKFINNLKQYVVNYNGVRLYFRIFKEKRVVIVSDS